MAQSSQKVDFGMITFVLAWHSRMHSRKFSCHGTQGTVRKSCNGLDPRSPSQTPTTCYPFGRSGFRYERVHRTAKTLKFERCLKTSICLFSYHRCFETNKLKLQTPYKKRNKPFRCRANTWEFGGLGPSSNASPASRSRESRPLQRRAIVCLNVMR